MNQASLAPGVLLSPRPGCLLGTPVCAPVTSGCQRHDGKYVGLMGKEGRIVSTRPEVRLGIGLTGQVTISVSSPALSLGREAWHALAGFCSRSITLPRAQGPELLKAQQQACGEGTCTACCLRAGSGSGPSSQHPPLFFLHPHLRPASELLLTQALEWGQGCPRPCAPPHQSHRASQHLSSCGESQGPTVRR